jgi:SAM-dependent methyltransferase
VSFADHFSQQAADYRRFRPQYPPGLAAWLAATAPGRTLALDLATGNGQAAIDLAAHFDRVLASDASASQLAHAMPHPRVCYLRHTAETLPLRAGVADLIAAAQAAHWFDAERFHAEVRRVLRPGGLVALWTYSGFRVGEEVDTRVGAFYRDVVGPYWPTERRHVEQGYRSLPFPFTPVPAPGFALATDWTRAQLLRYIGTWSAVERYRADRGVDPLPALEAELATVWPDGGRRRLEWPLHLRIGRI